MRHPPGVNLPDSNEPNVGFDERLWPINCLLFVLSGIVIGLVLGTSRFDDPNIVSNAAFRLAVVLLGIGALFFSVFRLREKMVRRVQLCVLVSLLVHLGLGIYLHHKYIELKERHEQELAAEMAEDFRFETVPEYDWERIERPETEQAFEKPLDVALPDGKRGQTIDRALLDHEIQARSRQTSEPDAKPRQREPIQPRRAALSAPRRADDSGHRLSRQELLRELNSDTPIPQPKIERPSESHASTPTSEAARVARRAPGAISTQRRVSETQSPKQPSPRPLAMQRRSTEQATSNRDARNPARSRPTTHNLAASRLAEVKLPAAEEALRLADSAAAKSARQRPQVNSAMHPLDRPLPTAGEEMRRPAAEARRAEASRTTPPNMSEQSSEAESLARSDQGTPLPSAAMEVPVETTHTAARGAVPASGLEVSGQTAVVRSTRQAMPGTRSSATGSADFAVGASRSPARLGRRRATGRDEPSIERALADSGIARARNDSTSLPDHASLMAAPSPAASGQPGVGGKQLTIAPGDTARSSRGGARVLPVRSAAVGAGPSGPVGTPGRVSLADRRKVSRYESLPTGFSGGGTPLPRSTPGRNLTMRTTAEPVDVGSIAPTGADGVGTPAESRLAGGPRRHVFGLPGARRTEEAPGAELALTDTGPSRLQAPARRDLASQRNGLAAADSPSESSTLTRADRGMRLPSAAVAVKSTPRRGAAGLGSEQGGRTSSLDVGTHASVRRAASKTRPGKRTIPEGMTDRGVGTETVAVSLGHGDRNNRRGPIPEFTSMELPLGRSHSAAMLPISAEAGVIEGGEVTDSSVSAEHTLALGKIADRESRRGNLPTSVHAGHGTVDGEERNASAEVAAASIDRSSEIGRTAPTLENTRTIASLTRTGRGRFMPSLADEVKANMIGVGDPNAKSTTAGEHAVFSPGDATPSRRRGGLPVRNSAELGPGGLSHTAGRDVGLPSRHAREESLLVHAMPRRFLLERSGMRPVLDATAAEPTEFFRRRDPDTRARWVERFGGSPNAERAVELGLDYLAREQFDDGRWSLHQSPLEHNAEAAEFGQMSSDTAATGLALLSFFGAGYTHLGDKHRDTVRGGVDWLVRHQRKDGSLFTGGSDYVWLYSHGIAAIALCEAYGMTRDPALAEPAQRAIGFIVRSQHKTLGGWRYQPGVESDTSVSGWQLMAMKSAQMAELDVPKEAMARTVRWLDGAQKKEGALYVYNPHAADTPQQRGGRVPSLAMTAEGLLMRLYLGWSGTDAAVTEGTDYLLENLPKLEADSGPERDAYYWYYATQVMFHVGGDYWSRWNASLRPLLETSQIQDGPFAGSWSPTAPKNDRWGHAGGRHYVTTMHLLMLEVYYRHLPLFQSGAAE